METLKSLADKLKKFRINAGYTLEQFAEKTGMDKGNLSKIENGKQSIGMTVLLRILNALNGEIELFTPYSRNVVRFYNAVSVVYQIKEETGIEYLLTKPALKVKLEELTHTRPFVLVNLLRNGGEYEERDGQRFYKYTVEQLMNYLEAENGFIPEVSVLFLHDDLLNEPVEKQIRLKSVQLHE